MEFMAALSSQSARQVARLVLGYGTLWVSKHQDGLVGLVLHGKLTQGWYAPL